MKSTPAENNLIASMRHDWPSCFFSLTDDTQIATRQAGFTTCTSYDHWIGTGARKAYRDVLTNRLKNFIIGLKGSLDRGAGQPLWKLAARTLLDRVLSQFGALTTFIESFYQTLTSVSHFSGDRAWGLVGRCVGSIFEV
jgi:hypothetical protein